MIDSDSRNNEMKFQLFLVLSLFCHKYSHSDNIYYVTSEPEDPIRPQWHNIKPLSESFGKEKWVFAVFVSKYSFRGVSTYKNSAELRFCAVWEYDLSEICIWGQKLFCSLCIWGYHGIISLANYLPVLLILINQAAEFSQKRSVATCSVEYLKNDFCSRVK